MNYLKIIASKVIIAFMLVMSFSSCKKNESVTESLDNLQLSETIWEGTISSQEFKNIPIRVTFDDSSKGNYFITSEYKEELSSFSLNTTLNYTKKTKTLFFGGGYNNLLLGDWWIQERKENNIVLFRQVGENKDILNIYKTN